jgi:hypothetical protein
MHRANSPLQILLGVLTMSPWLLFLAYDLAFYIWRSATYELPWIGGRARGKQRPRAPSLKRAARNVAEVIPGSLGGEKESEPEGPRHAPKVEGREKNVATTGLKETPNGAH